MTITTTYGKPLALPFGKHQGRPLTEVPTPYLDWLVREAKLSANLRLAVGNELRCRGSSAPPPPMPAPRTCPRCGCPDLVLSWRSFSNGTRHILGVCGECGDRSWLPQTAENVADADAAGEAP